MGRSFRIYRSWMRIVRIVVVVVVVLFLILPLSVRFVMEIPAVQQKVAKELSDGLANKLGTRVMMDRVALSWQGALSVHHVQIYDQQDSLMVAARRLDLGLDLATLFSKRKLTLSQVRLFDAFIRIYRAEADKPLNIAFALDSLASRSSAQASRVAINTILLRGCRIDFQPMPQARHYLLSDLATKVRLLEVQGDHIRGDLRHLSFREQSGFVVKDLSGQCDIAGRDIRIQRLRLSLPSTNLHIPSIHLKLPLEGKLSSISIEADIAPSYIRPSDLASFYDPLAGLTQRMDLAGRLKADSSKIQIDGLDARYASAFRLSSSDILFSRCYSSLDNTLSIAQYLRIPPTGRLSLFAQEKAILVLANTIDTQDPKLGNIIRRIGSIDLRAQVKQTADNTYRIEANLASRIGAGTIDTELKYSHPSGLRPQKMKGFVSLTNANPSMMLPQLSEWGQTSADVVFDLQHDTQVYPLPYRGTLSARIGEINYHGKSYKEIRSTAESVHHGWEAQLTASLLEGNIRARGRVTKDINREPTLSFDLHTDQLAISSFLPTGPLSSHRLSGSASGHLSSFADIDRIVGNIQIDTIRLLSPTDSLCLGALTISAQGHPTQNRRIVLSSDYLHGSIGGNFALSQLYTQAQNLLLAGTPALHPHQGKIPLNKADYCAFDLTMNPLPEALVKYFNLPIRITSAIHLGGLLDVATGRLVARLSADEIRRGSDLLRNLYAEVVADNGKTNLLFKTNALVGQKGCLEGMKLTANAMADSINCIADFGYDAAKKHHGRVQFGLRTNRLADGSLLTACRILPSRLFLDQIEWQLSASHLLMGRDRLDIDHLSLVAPGRSVRVNGSVSRKATDSLQVELERINLNYVLHLAGVDFDMLDTDLSGQARIKDLYGEQIMTARVESERFNVNHSDCGSIVAYGSWNKHTQLIDLNASVLAGDTAQTSVTGFFRPLGDAPGLDLSFAAHHQPIQFVGEFLTGFSSGFDGTATGHVRLFGPFECLALEGQALAENVSITPHFIFTPYRLNGAVSFTPHSMNFHQMAVTDRTGQRAQFEGSVGYHPGFSDFSYDVRMQEAHDLMVYDVSPRQNEMIYGQAYASGEARLFGDEKKGTTLVTNLTTSAGTDLSLDFGRSPTTENKGMLRFTPFTRPQERQNQEKTKHKLDESTMPFAMSMHIAVTPSAKVRLLLDRKSGDGISGHARGDLRIDLDPDGKFGVFGKVSLVSGSYGLSLEQLLHKNFILKEGSTISFAGDPMLASLDLSAMYNLTANLADLDESLIAGLGRSNVPVSCILDLSGTLRSPTLSFDIDLPGSDAELQRRIRSLIDTEDMMTRQIAYLVMLGKFYTPPTGRASTATENITSVATSTLAEQLSYLLGGLSEKVQIGTSIKTNNVTFDDTDIELLLSSQLFDNRLLFNGNFGYRDNPYMRNTYVGEFDLEYKLTPSGNLRLKGYSHYNNMYQYLRQSLTTQGIGILYRKDFSSFADLLPLRHRGKIKAKQVLPPDSTRRDSITKQQFRR